MSYSGRCTITKTLRRFSSCDVGDSVFTDYDDNHFKYYFRVSFYANGSCPENEGHVSIIFRRNRPFGFFKRPVTLSCTASVIDASGDRRFPRSFAHISEGGQLSIFENFGFDRFINRSSLLNDSSELLPDDSLTLCLEIEFEIEDELTLPHFPRFGMQKENDNYYLEMGTEFGQYLLEMSPVLRRMMESPMMERESGRIKIQPEDERSCFFIYTFHAGSNLQVSLPDICQLYRFADRYDMQRIIGLCHQLLISFMRAMNTRDILDHVTNEIHILSDLAGTFESDEILREILAIFFETKKNFEDGTRILGAYNPIRLETEWRCDREGGEFVFRRIRSEPVPKDSLK